MKNYTFNWEIQTLLEQFVAAFNDVIIKRYDKNKNTISPLSGIKVNYVYGPKQRVFNSLQTPAPGGLTVPAIAVSIGGISRDNTRVFNKNDGFAVPYNTTITSSDYLKKIPQPVPININVNMTLITRYQSDMDQLISNFTPYCDPYIVISWKVPSLDGTLSLYEIRTEILWNGNINMTYPNDASASVPYRIIGDTGFIIKGWIFKKIDETYKKIYVINSDYNAINNNDENILTNIDDYSTEWFTISARPQLKKITPYKAIAFQSPLSSEAISINVFGKSFFNITNVYVSASNVAMFNSITLFNPFSAIASLSSKYPAFCAIPIPNFTLFNENFLTFELPQAPKTTGSLDIIVENEAGYGKLTVDSKLPFISSWSGATNLQFPYISGLQVSTVADPVWYLPNGIVLSELQNDIISDWIGFLQYDDV